MWARWSSKSAQPDENTAFGESIALMKIAVILFNLGGPSGPDKVEPFLRNLFSDPAIIRLPGLVRGPLARLIARRRAPVAQQIYQKLGGGSPILPQTEAQSRALENFLLRRNLNAKCFISMRYSEPFSLSVARSVKAWGAERILLLPLYPQYSTTTTASSFSDWRASAVEAGLTIPTTEIAAYPTQTGFIEAMAGLIRAALARRQPGLSYRLLFSAHGLPERIVAAGDPYPQQVEETGAALLAALDQPDLDARICYQSRVGPLKWIGPSTESEIERAGRQKIGLIVVPVAFVSEHSETLVELDMDYAALAQMVGVADYIRVPTVQVEPLFIEGLGDLVEAALKG